MEFDKVGTLSFTS